ncbi:MAG: NAD(P)-dependent oxidoreductase, partial [Oscillospiraceae bacterium]|nr:NAD(P)-dependent oxidoreductase [Oscillospiraceae bacterium]
GYLYSEDAARALLLAAQHCRKSAVYCLGSGQPRRLRCYLETIRDIIAPSALIGFGDIPYSDRQVMCLYADISALTNDTGFMPAVSFEEGIQRVVQGFKSDSTGKVL